MMGENRLGAAGVGSCTTFVFGVQVDSAVHLPDALDMWLSFTPHELHACLCACCVCIVQ